MNKSYLIRLSSALLLGGVLLTAGCKKDYEEPYSDIQDANGPVTLTGAIPVVTKYAPGEAVRIQVAVADPEQVQEIRLVQVVSKTDSTVAGTVAPNFTYDAINRTSSQLVTYTVPAGLPNKQPVRLDVVVNFKNGGSRTRAVPFNVARAPEIKFGATPATYRNGLPATQQSEDDFITYSLILNETGINTLPVGYVVGSAPPLFKTLDSLSYYYKIGNGPTVRIGSVRLSSGAAATRSVDVTVPRGSVGQQVTYGFVVYSLQQSASVSSAVTVVAPAPLPQQRVGRLAFGPNASPDSLSFNLKTGLNELNASPAANKDIYLTLNGSALVLATANATQFFRLPSTETSTQFFTSATVNSVARRYYQAQAAGQLTTSVAGLTVNDLILVKLRNTSEFLILRVLSTRASTAGSTARLRFDYRSI
ncbi:hypothetical protein SAMN02745146_0010 [Hymenobacter daecheongensis DSM 21074]|uniref:Uncharacterized protein n=1 Tax=Hymenobacter daecheongensis DSM 21074 TaxID=1121955 RepID=A0A1M6LQ91_9BACT|nr:hypothetical protein [Hymenobacter daecheongensis]SHJ73366.1 hypothetical protein SAMN02745146_0010 [Hymenobacter daecheongensis DSM 21074]